MRNAFEDRKRKLVAGQLRNIDENTPRTIEIALRNTGLTHQASSQGPLDSIGSQRVIGGGTQQGREENTTPGRLASSGGGDTARD